MAIAAGLFAAGCAMQSTGRAPRSTGMGKGPNPVDISSLGLREIEGELSAVEGDGLLVRGDDGEPLRLENHPDTSIFVEGGVGAWKDLQEGTRVRASFIEEDGKLLLQWIEVPRPEEPKKAPEAELPVGEEET